jgi:hypothetical protein
MSPPPLIGRPAAPVPTDSPGPAESPGPTGTPMPSATTAPSLAVPLPQPSTTVYPWHTAIVSTTFWVGEIFDPNTSDGSQMFSTYNSDWFTSFGGCDGVTVNGECQTEARNANNSYFPTAMSPLENPFYLDLPFDDINDAEGFATRDAVVPWAGEEPYASHRGDQRFSYLKNRWVQLTREGRTCYGQIQDAGPAEYHDAQYVFGTDDTRPVNTRYHGAGLDVSPAITGCLSYPELDGDSALVDWRFVDDADVPPGPWLRIVTTSQVR